MKNVLRSAAVLAAALGLSAAAMAQLPAAPQQLKTLGTRSWIRLSWQDAASNEQGYKIYWNTTAVKPAAAGAVIGANSNRYYINSLTAATTYYVWVEAYNSSGTSAALNTSVVTTKQWTLDSAEVNNLSVPSSAAVPAGMQLYWHDEFNDLLLNRNKWSTNYYSTIDFKSGTNLSAMQNDTLPQPGIIMTGSTIQLITNDTMPAKSYWPTRKLSSIQTYDWRSDERYVDNSRGGYFEIRCRRSNTTNATTGLNVAYWLDSPGPDLKYYMEQGTTYNGVAGVRPRGQAFEIDVFEQSGNATTTGTTPFTMHGNVAADGTFQGNLTTYNASLSGQNNWTTHGLLWTAAGIKYYINGALAKEWSNPQQNMAPNHFMNILLGNYYGWSAGMTSTAMMEVDYIRGYQWPVSPANELPDNGFEYTTLYPWSGNGTLTTTSPRSGSKALSLAAGQSVVQYIFLNNSQPYQLKYWLKGSGSLQAKIENTTQVSGVVKNQYLLNSNAAAAFSESSIDFTTTAEYTGHMTTVKLTLTNTGTGTITVDDMTIAGGGNGGSPAPCTAGGGANAQDRYITSLSTAGASHNISFTGNAYPAGGYGVYTADSVVVKRDSSFTLNILNSTNTRWARVNVYADWNNNGSFTDSGELLFSVGSARQDNSGTVLNISRSITVPAAAVTGKVRLRVRCYDAWNNDPGPCGQADYTTTQDFFMQINVAGELSRQAMEQPVKTEIAATGITVYPNPVPGNNFQADITLPSANLAQIRIYNMSGAKMYSMEKRLVKGNNKINLSASVLPAGVYVLEVSSGGKIWQRKFIRQ
ncbi:GEVED domain-containing protein [Chitinophaga solisilvae]|uniref:GEVED domain-containing protein n=1 Tax=Chitinophaga solisilvae TaxID=1233460 RepID=UPI00136F54A6|nr:GEVED domain-containing protein [Chitinophaga solisilvae]